MTTTPQADGANASSHELQRKLSNRHLQLIAIGGAIGTGLFMGSGKTISLAGPSILIIYMIIGTMFFFLMRALGEILLSNFSVHDKFHRTLILSGFCLLKIAKISLNSSFFPKPIKR